METAEIDVDLFGHPLTAVSMYHAPSGSPSGGLVSVCQPSYYRTIVIDPPWPGPGEVPAFDSELSAGKIASVLIPYSTMTGIQVAALRVSEIATMDAQLWIWCCSRSVGDAFLLCQAWGFKYRGLFVWRKVTGKGGLGMNMRNQCEFLLWGARRGARISDGVECPWQVHEWRRPGGHSEKPGEAYDMIRHLSDEPRIDIFARQARPGFDRWGNQAPDEKANIPLSVKTHSGETHNNEGNRQ